MLKKLFVFFLYSSLFMAVCAIVMLMQTNKLFNLSYNKTNFFGFVFSSTICSYNLHWYLTPASPKGSSRIQWTDKYRNVLLIFFIVALISSLVFAITFLQNWLAIGIAVAATFLYTAPKIPLKSFAFLKNIAVGKTIFLSFVWMYVTTMMPILISAKPWTLLFTVFCIGRFFFI
jgi:divalent metal cation (Fe/Co/Zn/Cd) transporter